MLTPNCSARSFNDVLRCFMILIYAVVEVAFAYIDDANITKIFDFRKRLRRFFCVIMLFISGNIVPLQQKMSNE